jgi:predicted DNA-binding transcriptional regulator AlpA
MPDIAADDSNVVRSIKKRAVELGLADSTLRDLIAKGEGPAVVRLSPGRVGIRTSDLRAWLDARTVRPSEFA